MQFLVASLIGQPLEAPGVLPEDAATRLAEVHESAWTSMKVVFHALWPKEEHVLEDMSVLAERLKRARCRIQAWKVSACREGAREA
jgi:hypothetical protein